MAVATELKKSEAFEQNILEGMFNILNTEMGYKLKNLGDVKGLKNSKDKGRAFLKFYLNNSNC
jgi:metal-sulfur cluster biosynthetic enzyme